MKPILATDVDVKKLQFPVLTLNKIDGVRALNLKGRLVGRSGKEYKNGLNTEFFSDPCFKGFDGELVVNRITGDGICNETTSAMTTIKGQVECRWCVFDYITHETQELPYEQRHAMLVRKVQELHDVDPSLVERLWVVPYRVAYDENDLLTHELLATEAGYEGLILRDPNGRYKFGRSTVREGLFLRLKRFMDAEIEVTAVEQGLTNQNELKANPHGYAERSTLAEHMAPNGMVGTILGRLLEDIEFNGRVLFTAGTEIEVAPGKMAHADRKYYWEHPEDIVGKLVKFQFFPVGVKDKPRFPTFQCFRDANDLG